MRVRPHPTILPLWSTSRSDKHLRNLLGSHLEHGRQVLSCDRMPAGEKPDQFTAKGVMVTAQPTSQLPGKQLQ